MEVATELDLELLLIPRVLTATRITTEIKATSRLYPVALAVSSLKMFHHFDILPLPSRPLEL